MGSIVAGLLCASCELVAGDFQIAAGGGGATAEGGAPAGGGSPSPCEASHGRCWDFEPPAPLHDIENAGLAVTDAEHASGTSSLEVPVRTGATESAIAFLDEDFGHLSFRAALKVAGTSPPGLSTFFIHLHYMANDAYCNIDIGVTDAGTLQVFAVGGENQRASAYGDGSADPSFELIPVEVDIDRRNGELQVKLDGRPAPLEDIDPGGFPVDVCLSYFDSTPATDLSITFGGEMDSPDYDRVGYVDDVVVDWD